MKGAQIGFLTGVCIAASIIGMTDSYEGRRSIALMIIDRSQGDSLADR